jgi:hypothetical protein
VVLLLRLNSFLYRSYYTVFTSVQNFSGCIHFCTELLTLCISFCRELLTLYSCMYRISYTIFTSVQRFFGCIHLCTNFLQFVQNTL